MDTQQIHLSGAGLDKVMGNEISQTHGVKQSVGGEGQPGQFHKVLVDSDYAVPEIELPDGNFVVTRPADVKSEQTTHDADDNKENIHQQTTLKIRGPSSEVDGEVTDPAEPLSLLEKGLQEEDSLFEECKALISEAADRAVKRQLSKPTAYDQITSAPDQATSTPDQITSTPDQATSTPDQATSVPDQVTSIPDQVTDLDTNSSNGSVVEQVEIVEQRKSTSSFTQVADQCTVSTDPAGGEDNKDNTEKKDDTIIGGDGNVGVDIEKGECDFELIGAVDSNVDYADLTYTDIKTTETEINNKKPKQKSEGKSKKGKSKKKNFEEIEREVIESVKEQLDSKEDTETKSPNLEKKSSRGNLFTNMFKFSRRKPKADVEVITSVNGGTVDTKNDAIVLNAETENKPSTSFDAINEEPVEVKRLNSLDSGIGVEKPVLHVHEQQQPESVEYAVVQKKLKDIVSTNVETKENLKTGEEEIIANPVVGQRLAEPIYLNGDKADEDFVYINERAVDVEELVNQTNVTVVEALPVSDSPSDDGKSDKADKNGSEEAQSDISSDSGTGMGTKVIKTDKPTKPEKAKLKKKSWSFQFGKGKSSAQPKEPHVTDGREPVVHEPVVSMDPGVMPREPKKSRWRLGKFSFRKSSSDISASTPNLHKIGIPEEGEEGTSQSQASKPDKKKSSKLKLLKSKKDKKKESQQVSPALDQRCTSMIDIVLDDNSPRSRKSIVEDDASLHQTDAFHGVELSDLSDGETASKKTDESKADKKKKSKKKSEKKQTTKDMKQAILQPADIGASGQIYDSAEPLDVAVDTASAGAIDIAKDNTEVSTAETPAENSPVTIDDEYVNIVDVSKDMLESAANEDIVHETVDGIEYAMVQKRKEDEETSDANNVATAGAEVPVDVVISPEVTKLVEATTDSRIEDAEQDRIIIEPPTDFKDTEAERGDTSSDDKPDDIDASLNTQAFSNAIYGDESIKAIMEEVKRSMSQENKESSEDVKVEDNDNVFVESTPVIDQVGDAYVTLKEVNKEDNDTVKEIDVGKSEIQTTESATSAINDETTVKPKVNPGRFVSETKLVFADIEPVKVAHAETCLEQVVDVHRNAVPEVEIMAEKNEQVETSSPTEVAINGEVGENKEVDEGPVEKTVVSRVHQTAINFPSTDIQCNGVAESDPSPEVVEPQIEKSFHKRDSEVSLELESKMADIVNSVEKTNTVAIDNQVEETNLENQVEINNAVNGVDDVSQAVCEDIETPVLIIDTQAKPGKSERRVIVMKDIGVQAPDIYIPLDIEKDFGSCDSKLGKVSIGVQVSTEDLDVEHVVIDSNSSPTSPTSDTPKSADAEALSAAYF